MRRFIAVALFAALLVGVVALPASAGRDEAPAQVCKEIDNTFPPDPDRPFAFTIPSDGGCASSVAQGFPESHVLTNAAFNAQCKFLEGGAFFPDGSYFELNYPYNFYGNPDYLANNRADCIKFLSAFHNGELPPGPGGGE